LQLELFPSVDLPDEILILLAENG